MEKDEKMLPSGSALFTDEKELAPGTQEAENVQEVSRAPFSGTPSAAQQSWGVVISIAIIVLMIIIGAFYAWGERIAKERAFQTSGTEL